jgi:hypothetical protein
MRQAAMPDAFSAKTISHVSMPIRSGSEAWVEILVALTGEIIVI